MSQTDTEEKTLEAQLEATQARLAQLEHFRREMLSVISHDLRSPLTGILGAIELLTSGDLNNPDEQASLINIIRTSAQYMSILIDGLLDIAMMQDGRLILNRQPVRLTDLLAECVASWQTAAQSRGIVCCLEVAAEVPPVQADAGRLYQIFDILIGKTVRMTPRGGSILVTCHQVEGRWTLTTIGTENPALKELTGPTCSDNTNAETDLSRRWGLEVRVSKQLIELHGGQMETMARPEGSPTFRVWLPLH